MACCVFAAYLFGLLWRSVRAVTGAVGTLSGRRPARVEVVAPGAVRTVVIPHELREPPERTKTSLLNQG
jgi:hypothetical protein